MPIASIIFVNNRPARPTNGSACISSSRPGPSPINISLAFAFPYPKTMAVRPWVASGQREQSAKCFLSWSSCCWLELEMVFVVCGADSS